MGMTEREKIGVKCIKKQFDPDLSPDNIHNQEAAKDHDLKFDRKQQVYKDTDGCPVRDRFGQPL